MPRSLFDQSRQSAAGGERQPVERFDVTDVFGPVHGYSCRFAPAAAAEHAGRLFKHRPRSLFGEFSSQRLGTKRRVCSLWEDLHVTYVVRWGRRAGHPSAPAGVTSERARGTHPLSPAQPRAPPAGGIVVPARTRQDGQQTRRLSRGPGPIGQGTAPIADPAARGYSYAIGPHGLSKLGAGGRAFSKC